MCLSAMFLKFLYSGRQLRIVHSGFSCWCLPLFVLLFPKVYQLQRYLFFCVSLQSIFTTLRECCCLSVAFRRSKSGPFGYGPLLPASASWRTSGSAPGGQVPRVHRPLGAVPSCLPQEPKVLALHFICLGAGTRAGVDFCVFDRPHRCNEFLSSGCVFVIACCGAAATS